MVLAIDQDQKPAPFIPNEGQKVSVQRKAGDPLCCQVVKRIDEGNQTSFMLRGLDQKDRLVFDHQTQKWLLNLDGELPEEVTVEAAR